MVISCFTMCFSIALKIGVNCYMVGVENYLTQAKPISFEETSAFKMQASSNFYDALFIAEKNETEFRNILLKDKDKTCNSILDAFVADKVSIIKGELKYAVENWDNSYYKYEDQAEEITTPENYTAVYVGEETPINVKLAAKILANAKGEEFLEYESLVRGEAFANSFPKYVEIKADEYGAFEFGVDIPRDYSKEKAKEYIWDEYDRFISQEYRNFYDCVGAQYRLADVDSFKYYIKDHDGIVTSNIDSIPKNLDKYSNYFLIKDGRKMNGFSMIEDIEYFLEKSDVNELCLFIDDSFGGDDIYGRMYQAYSNINTLSSSTLLIQLIISFVLFVFFIVICFSLVGKKRNEKAEMIFIDKLPNDLHLLLSGGIIAAFTCAILNVFESSMDAMAYTNKLNLFITFYSSLCFVVLAEWIASVVRIKKAGESYFKNTIIYKLFDLIIRFSLRLFKKLKKEFRYKPKTFKIKFIAVFFAYLLINTVLAALFFTDMYCVLADGFFVVVSPIIALIFNGFVCYEITKYVNNLDKIIVASGKNENIDFGGKKVDYSLVVLAENLKNSNKNLNKAVAEAVKNEQMKTELITNVSHDLKTPLTSLINYSDLLGKCNVDDEKANEYIKVLNTQSIKLKHLIDDLIEASKVSTGNVQFNKINLNLYELVVQAMVEFTPDFEKNMLDVKLQEPTNTPVVYADGNKTYRIISNLLSNVKKYAAPNTRVYASVYSEDQFGCFEIKNISKEALNISPDELVERFVRGDESRSKEGNGLGLSIAKDLCELQNGELKISIDGDLFKVVVKLPVK